MRRKILLTGTTGFIGRALLSRFIDDNRNVCVLVRNQNVDLPRGISSFITDISNLSDIDSGIFNDVDVVVHTAARAHIMNDELVEPLAEYRKVNREATLALACLAADAHVKRFIFISSIKVNGEYTLTNKPFNHIVTSKPKDPYGLSKYEAELGLLSIAKETGMEVVIIRPPLVYGPGVKGNFAAMVKWIKKGIPLPLGSVQNQRSLVALDNLVDFIALCADLDKSPNAANQTFLISDGEDVSTSELLRKVAQAYGVKPHLLPVPVGLMRFFANLLRKNAVADRLFGNLQVDSSKVGKLLGWKPIISMDEQLAKMAKQDMKSRVG